MNKLNLNPDKTEVLLIGPELGMGDDILPVLDGVALPPEFSGVHFKSIKIYCYELG